MRMRPDPLRVFEVKPLVGVGAIRLGASRTEVHRVLGPPANSFLRTTSSIRQTESWFKGSFQVSYASDLPIAEFIELSSASAVRAILFGREVFSTPVSALVALLREHAEFDPDDPELGFSYVFPSLELSLWRPDEESVGARCFSTVGIGARGYFSLHQDD